MPEMILDSLFLITNAYIDKHKKLPIRVCVRRKVVSRLYHIAIIGQGLWRNRAPA